MAGYGVNHRCGHPRVVRLVGKTDERRRKVEWMEGHDCPDCERAAWNATAAAEADRLRAGGLVDDGWPPLAGSEKQIAWAETVRAGLLRDVVARAIEWEGKYQAQLDGADAGATAEIQDLLDELGAAVARIRAEGSARYWIDNRRRDPLGMIQDAIREARSANA